jgi:serine/threonine protein kinase
MDETEPGRLLAGRYRLNMVIGQGGMGVVWRGHDELLDRDVAVKEILLPSHLTEQEQRLACRRATREAQMAGRLSHQNVVRVYDIVEEDGHPWIVMEFLPYRSLRDLILEDGPLSPQRAAEVGLGVLAALRAAHQAGILHRDVKPANVLVGTDGRVVLTDFGIARSADSTTLTAGGTLLGSPSYIAPERAKGGLPGGAGAPGDLWGLGASLYAAVEGRPPFERDGALATLTAVVVDEPYPARNAGPLEPVISGLLLKDPDVRLSADETEQMLRKAIEEEKSADAVPPPRAPLDGPVPPGSLAESAAQDPSGPPGLSDSDRPASPDAAAGPDSLSGPTAPRGGLLRPRGPRGLRVLLAALVLVAAAATALVLVLTSSPGQPTAAPAGSTRSASSGPSALATPATSPAAATSPGAASSTGTPAEVSPAASARAAGADAGYGALPAGYHRFTNSTGFSIGVPNGWLISHVGHYVYVRDPSNSGIYLLIDQSDDPQPNPLADWEQQQANRESDYPDYHLIRLQSVSYPQAEKAADWEFTYLREGVPVHILNRNVLANAKHAYALYWSAPESDWNADYHYFTAFAATFRPAAA